MSEPDDDLECYCGECAHVGSIHITGRGCAHEHCSCPQFVETPPVPACPSCTALRQELQASKVTEKFAWEQMQRHQAAVQGAARALGMFTADTPSLASMGLTEAAANTRERMERAELSWKAEASRAEAAESRLREVTQERDALKAAMQAIVELGKVSDVDAEPDKVFNIAGQALGVIGEESWLDERRVRDVVCPQCRKEFELGWNDWSNKPATLQIRGCPSGGIYDVIISCPHCNYEEPL